MAESLNIQKIKNRIHGQPHKKHWEDLATTNKDYAIFLPSISSLYSKHSSKPAEKIRGGNLPSALSSIDDLDFLDPIKGQYWYPWILYSAGHAQLDLQKAKEQESLIHKRNKEETFVVADSGGYQLSTGVLKFDHINPDTMRHKILKWMESTADYSMILDIPTTSCSNPKSFIYQESKTKNQNDMFRDCLNYTIDNCQYFLKHRTPGATKLLNVLQGRNDTEGDIWWDQVKDFDFEGWAIPGNLKADMRMFFRRLIIMRDGGYLTKHNENMLIHFLGISRLTAGLAYTTIQKEMRKHINEKTIITYDAASPFVSTAKGKGYTEYNITRNRLAYKMNILPDDTRYYQSDELWPWRDSPMGKETTIGDICCYKEKGRRSTWDGMSYVLIMNMNVNMHIKALQHANRLYELDDKVANAYIPSNLLQFRDLVGEILTSEKPFDVIDKNAKLLKNVFGMRMGKPITTLESSGLFSMEESTQSKDFALDDDVDFYREEGLITPTHGAQADLLLDYADGDSMLEKVLGDDNG